MFLVYIFASEINDLIVQTGIPVLVLTKTSRPANLRGGQLCEIVKGAIFGSMITNGPNLGGGQLHESHAEILRVGRPEEKS